MRTSELTQLVGEREHEHTHSTEGGMGLEPLCSCFLSVHLPYYDKEQVFLQGFPPSLGSRQPWVASASDGGQGTTLGSLGLLSFEMLP